MVQMVQAMAAVTEEMRKGIEGRAAGGGGKHRNVLDGKNFDMKKFDGTEGQFAEWKFAFRNAVGTSSTSGLSLLDGTSTRTDEITWDEVKDD